ncbi:MAG: DUF2723 domain-containing protein [Geobacteraceae bacterium]
MINREYMRRIDIHAVLSVIIPLFVYLCTLAPSVTFFDSGEFITAIYSLGSAHSPGYPLFINYAKPFTYLPFGNIAFRVNIATAISAAAACYCVYLLVSHFLATEETGAEPSFSASYCKLTALCAALAFAFSARLWLQSNHDKPYPLISLMAALIFYLLLRWRDHYRQGEERPAYIYLSAFLCGLAFGAHQTMVLLLPSYAFLILSMDLRLLLRVRELLLTLAFATFGFAVQLHMPIRATQNPLLNWGDPKTVDQFLWHFLREGYPVEKPTRNLALVWDQMKAFNIPHEYTWVGLALLVIGILAFFRKLRQEILAYLIGVFFFLLVIIGYLNTPADMIFLTEEFFTPLYLLSAVFMGLGLFYLLEKAVNSLSAAKQRTLPVQLTVLYLLLALPVSICALHYVENDQHENYVAYDYGTNSLRSLPQGAVLYTWGDSGAFPLWYLQGVERMREDLDLLHTPHLSFRWYLDGFPKLFRHSILRAIPLEEESPERVLQLAISEQIERRPVFIDFSTRYSISFDNYLLQQKGICYQLEKVGSAPQRPPDLEVWRLYNLRGISGGMFFRDLDTGKAILIYANSYMEAGDMLMRLDRIDEGVRALRMAERISPELRFQVGQILSGYGVK